MREFGVAATGTVAVEDNLSDMVFATAERFAGSVLYRRKVRDTWVDVTAREFAAQVLAVARGLVAAGLAPGDRVGLLARTSYEWTLLDFAILTAGCVTVPLPPDGDPDWMIGDCGARAVITESALTGPTGVEHVWPIDTAADDLAELGADVADEDVHARRREVGADDTATLVYTSAPGGVLRGCELTHRNVLAEVRAVAGSAPELLNANASVLLFLPLSHMFARLVQFGAVHARVTVGHTADVRNLLPDLAEFRPTLVLAVPQVFERVHAGARRRAIAAGRGKLFELGEATAIAWSRARQHGRPGLPLQLAHGLFDRLVYERLRAALGGRCGAVISGGAPLDERLGHFFSGIGIPVYEGYGLTETSAAATLNTPRQRKIGTVGRPLPGVTVRISDHGEIQLRGDVVFPRYWNDPRATTASRTPDGWLHTGDRGELDPDGYLRITGRL